MTAIVEFKSIEVELERTTSLQADAADPAASVWVSANAGTGARVRMRYAPRFCVPSHTFVPHRERQLRHLRGRSHAVRASLLRTTHTLSCPIGSAN